MLAHAGPLGRRGRRRCTVHAGANLLSQSGENTRLVPAGVRSSAAGGRTGRRSRFPPQFGHARLGKRAAHAGHQVHSNVQM